jgi:hypothetical protein
VGLHETEQQGGGLLPRRDAERLEGSFITDACRDFPSLYPLFFVQLFGDSVKGSCKSLLIDLWGDFLEERVEEGSGRTNSAVSQPDGRKALDPDGEECTTEIQRDGPIVAHDLLSCPDLPESTIAKDSLLG